MACPSLSLRASVRLPWPRFQSPALRTRRADFPHRALQWDHAPRTRTTRTGRGRKEPVGPVARGRCTTAILPPTSFPVCRQTCSRPGGVEPFGSDPFASACDAFRSLCPQGGVIGWATPAGIHPFRVPPHLRLLPSTGITRRPQYYGPLRHPDGPDWSSRISGWCVHTTDRASRVASSFILQTCRRHYPGGNDPVRLSLASRTAVGLPLIRGGSAPALSVSRPARRSLAFRPICSLSRPRQPFCQSASAYIVTSVSRPGCYQPKRQLLGGIRTHKDDAPFTAHAK